MMEKQLQTKSSLSQAAGMTHSGAMLDGLGKYHPNRWLCKEAKFKARERVE
jgi:hypothetical protein